MDISRINSDFFKGIAGAQEALQNDAAKSAQSNNQDSVDLGKFLESDQAHLGAMAGLKQMVLDQDAVDSKMVEVLKEAIRSGEFDPSGEEIVAGMGDEFVDFLVE